MANNDDSGKAIHLTDEQVKNLLILLHQQGDAIDELWDAVIELKCLAADAGLPVKDAQKWQDSARKRVGFSSSHKILRQRFFDGLNLG
jgi:hypothetical protein